MPTIEQLNAQEILDSRGRPTLEVTCHLTSGVSGAAQVPSGASTGKSEAVELRDGDHNRHAGMGCLRAADHVASTISDHLRHKHIDDQQSLDGMLIDLDGTSNKSRLGANAILGTSLAFARASAAELGVPLYRHLAQLIDHTIQKMPQLTINLFSGGKHAGGQVSIQDVLILPVSARDTSEGLAMATAVYRAAANHVRTKYDMRPLTADEGGLAPNFASVDAMFEDAIRAIEDAGLKPRHDISLAVDVAASHFFHDGAYELDDSFHHSQAMIEQLEAWVEQYPIVSVEDGLAEDDWQNWPTLRSRLAGKALTLGDDLLCTNSVRIRKAIELDACDALLLKVNQIGSLTEAAEALRLARGAGWHVTISARSGETEDNWLADLAVGWGGDHIKIGSVTRSERLSKYNRLLSIEADATA